MINTLGRIIDKIAKKVNTRRKKLLLTLREHYC